MSDHTMTENRSPAAMHGDSGYGTPTHRKMYDAAQVEERSKRVDMALAQKAAGHGMMIPVDCLLWDPHTGKQRTVKDFRSDTALNLQKAGYPISQSLKIG